MSIDPRTSSPNLPSQEMNKSSQLYGATDVCDSNAAIDRCISNK
ncbi:hypothetical protein COLO4_16163 [Corchorus olitorius]|uniref:Uncharacterized protein n=1 Tax=Corchorus olitorius TaxID=93759 RepID=A0A1R3JIX2_9ROSI|nr:hypothetical protein COLO4_16163 [Corchorus olitorius]